MPNLISKILIAEGFVYLGHVPLSAQKKHFIFFQRWLKKNHHAQMEYLTKNKEIRANPSLLDKKFRSAILIALPYAGNDTLRTDTPRIAQYARGRDYHRVIKEKVARAMRGFPEVSYRTCVDTAPILERALAVRGGRGFIGKNTCFISPEHGSFLLLAEILTDLNVSSGEIEEEEVDPSKRSERGGCGSCKRCQVYCPTGALDDAYQLDANKCLSYQTIENRGEIPRQYWQYLQNYFYGCDICQTVCPYNKSKKKISQTPRSFPNLPTIACMTQREYERYFGGTALTRAKRHGLMRNALIAMHVGNHPQLGECIDTLVARHEFSDTHPLVRTMQTIIRERRGID